MSPNERMIENFYIAFDDEVFSLRGKPQVRGMWRMLCAATKDKDADEWKLRFGDARADGNLRRYMRSL